MAKKMTMSAITLYNLTNFFGSISPQEAAKMKPEEAVKASVRISKIFEELDAVNEPFESLQKKYADSINEEVKAHAPQVDAIKALNLPKAEEDAKIAQYVQKANEEIKEKEKALSEELGYEAKKKELVEVVINSDDRFTLLKEVFAATACDKYLNLKALAETSEAIDTAVDA